MRQQIADFIVTLALSEMCFPPKSSSMYCSSAHILLANTTWQKTTVLDTHTETNSSNISDYFDQVWERKCEKSAKMQLMFDY